MEARQDRRVHGEALRRKLFKNVSGDQYVGVVGVTPTWGAGKFFRVLPNRLSGLAAALCIS